MGPLAYTASFGGHDMAVDLGSANTLVHVRGYGIVICEPSVVAVESLTGEVRGIGLQAHDIAKGGDGVNAIRPIRDGLIADSELTQRLLRHLIHLVHRSRWARPRMVLCVPASVTSVHALALGQACLDAGARQAYLIEQPLAAAIGAGLPVGEPAGSMILDIGGAITEAAVISLGGIVVSRSIGVGGNQLDEAIVKYLKSEHELLIDRRTAEYVKLKLGSAFALGTELKAKISGREIVSELPKTVLLTSDELRAALEKPLAQIFQAVKDALARTPPELASDVSDRGIVLAGGGSLLRGLPARLCQEMQMPVQLAESPRTCVARGSGSWLENVEAAEGRRSSQAHLVSVSPVAAMR
jgi:rod shape-determining protein MreB and related proteins